MPIDVRCPSCKASLKAPDEAAGKRIRCPQCQQVVEVPQPAEEADIYALADEAPVAKPKLSAEEKLWLKAMADTGDTAQPAAGAAPAAAPRTPQPAPAKAAAPAPAAAADMGGAGIEWAVGEEPPPPASNMFALRPKLAVDKGIAEYIKCMAHGDVDEAESLLRDLQSEAAEARKVLKVWSKQRNTPPGCEGLPPPVVYQYLKILIDEIR